MKFRSTRLRTLREGQGLSPGQLAYKAGISRDYVYLLEKGERPNVSGTIVAEIARALETSCDYLYGLTDDPCQLTVVKGLKSQSLMSELTGMFGERMTECIKLMATLPSEERATICDFVEFVAARRSR